MFQREKIGEEDLEDIGQLGQSNWYLPIQWCFSNIAEALENGRFCHTDRYSDVFYAIDSFRQGLQDVSAYRNVTLPQVYTQVSQKNY